MRQHYKGGLLVKSGNKIVYRDDDIIKRTADAAYADIMRKSRNSLLEEAKESFKNKVGESIVRDTLYLSDDSYLEAELLPNGIDLRYCIRDNRFRFWVTTPDVKVLHLEIGASRHLDPGFEVFFDLTINMQATNVHDLNAIRLTHCYLEANINFEGSNITGKIAAAIVRVIDKAIAWIKNEDGFLKSLENYSKDLYKVKDDINAQLQTMVIQNQVLLQEMKIDESNEINYQVDETYLVLTHPHSEAGVLKRMASVTIADAMDNKLSTTANTFPSSNDCSF